MVPIFQDMQCREERLGQRVILKILFFTLDHFKEMYTNKSSFSAVLVMALMSKHMGYSWPQKEEIVFTSMCPLPRSSWRSFVSLCAQSSLMQWGGGMEGGQSFRVAHVTTKTWKVKKIVTHLVECQCSKSC